MLGSDAIQKCLAGLLSVLGHFRRSLHFLGLLISQENERKRLVYSYYYLNYQRLFNWFNLLMQLIILNSQLDSVSYRS